MPTHQALMYSYKGGAGRTTATANIAAVLAKDFGKRVVCIDLDIESAGLAVVFRVQHKLGEGGRRCLQDVLRRKAFRSQREFEEWWPTLHVDVGTQEHLAPGMLLFIPSRAAHHESVEWGDRSRAGDPIDDLLSYIRVCNRPDFVLMDSASGLSDPACVGLGCANSVVNFLRWNRQFLQGTIEAAKFILSTSEPGGNLTHIKKLLLVPTAVPEIGADEIELQHSLEANQRRIKLELDIETDSRVELLDPIPESRWLKWEERILAFESHPRAGDKEVLAAYHQVAAKLIETAES